MKLSKLILEEYQEEAETYKSIKKNGGDCDYTIKTITRLTQAHKDALYMEEQIEKAQEEDAKNKEEEERDGCGCNNPRYKSYYSESSERHYYGCISCGFSSLD